jgi:hypothetical protein
MTGKCYDEPSACTGSMDENLRRTLSDFLPKDAAERCNGTGFVSVTVYDSGAPTAGVVSSFSDRSDLIGTLAASSYIPFWSGSQLVTDWRGRQALDGSVSTRQPACPDASKYCIRIASRAPDMNGGATAGENSGNRFGNAFRQIRLAMSGARSSAGSVPKPKLPSLAEAKADPARLEMYKAKGLDIAPGLAAPNPFPPETWSEVHGGRGGGRAGGGRCGGPARAAEGAAAGWGAGGRRAGGPGLAAGQMSSKGEPLTPLSPGPALPPKNPAAEHAAVRPRDLQLHLCDGPDRCHGVGQGDGHRRRRRGREEGGCAPPVARGAREAGQARARQGRCKEGPPPPHGPRGVRWQAEVVQAPPITPTSRPHRTGHPGPRHCQATPLGARSRRFAPNRQRPCPAPVPASVYS